MPTLAEICDMVAQTAENIGGQKITVDEPTVELLLPVVLNKVILDQMNDAGKVRTLVKTHEIEFTDGVGDLPENVMPEFFKMLELFDDDGEVSLVSNYSDFRRGGYDVLNYFNITGDKIYYKNNISDVDSITAELRAVTSPSIPTAENTNFDAPKAILDELYIELVRAIRGETPYLKLGDEEKES